MARAVNFAFEPRKNRVDIRGSNIQRLLDAGLNYPKLFPVNLTTEQDLDIYFAVHLTKVAWSLHAKVPTVEEIAMQIVQNGAIQIWDNDLYNLIWLIAQEDSSKSIINILKNKVQKLKSAQAES